MMSEEEGIFLRHEPCEECGSKDNKGVWTDHTYCFGCGASTREAAGDTNKRFFNKRKVMDYKVEGECLRLEKRKLNADTCEKYRFQVGVYDGDDPSMKDFKGKKCHIENHYNDDGQVIAQKLRFAGKKIRWIGDVKAAQPLWGMSRFSGGKFIVITEGAYDAMTFSQIQNNQYPAVSIKGGATEAKKNVAAALDYLKRFETVILAFDMDAPGRKAVEECVHLFEYGKVKIADMPCKDANECLQEGKVKELIQSFWNAAPPSVGGALAGEEAWDRFINRPKITCYPYPEDIMPIFQRLQYGISLGSLDVWTSGSGMGKTTVIKQLQHHFLKTTDLTQAIIHMEEDAADSIEGILGMEMGKRLGLPDVRDTVTDAECRAAFDTTFGMKREDGTPRLHVKDAFFETDDEDTFNFIREMAIGAGVQVFWIDHLSMMVSEMDQDGDERRRIDAIMHKLKKLTKELNIYIGLIVHLRKGGNGSFEEGAVPSLDDLRGSGAIKQLSNSVFAMSRNQQDTDEVQRNTSQLHILKSRLTGATGPADFIYFNPTSGRMQAGEPPCSESKSAFKKAAADAENGEF